MIVTAKEAKRLGLIRYFTGKLCKNGHCAERYVCSRICVECGPNKTKKWRSKNRDKVRAQPSSSPAKQREYHARWYYKDPERSRELARQSSRRCRIARPELATRTAREWREANKQKVTGYRQSYRKSNPERTRLQSKIAKHKRRARKLKSGGSYTVADVASILRAQRGRCGYCRAKLSDKYHIDHIEPLARGGSNDPRNLQILCRDCNQKKWAHDPIVFVREHFGLLL